MLQFCHKCVCPFVTPLNRLPYELLWTGTLGGMTLGRLQWPSAAIRRMDLILKNMIAKLGWKSCDLLCYRNSGLG
jgi:hypothetical protein